jgi:hypothetical protein
MYIVVKLMGGIFCERGGMEKIWGMGGNFWKVGGRMGRWHLAMMPYIS